MKPQDVLINEYNRGHRIVAKLQAPKSISSSGHKWVAGSLEGVPPCSLRGQCDRLDRYDSHVWHAASWDCVGYFRHDGTRGASGSLCWNEEGQNTQQTLGRRCEMTQGRSHGVNIGEDEIYWGVWGVLCQLISWDSKPLDPCPHTIHSSSGRANQHCQESCC